MIGLIITGIAFVWLGYETDWLRVRLLVGNALDIGACSLWRLADNQVTDDMKRELIGKRNGKRRTPGEFGDGFTPLCGWGFAYQYKDFKPEYKIELFTEKAHYTMRTENVNILRDAFRVYRNPYLKVKL